MNEEQLTHLVGRAAVDLWSRLPQDIQQRLFERAADIGQADDPDGAVREILALFLHAHHERTAVHDVRAEAFLSGRP